MSRGDAKRREFRRNDGGGGRNRTGVDGFAGRCMTTLPPRPLFGIHLNRIHAHPAVLVEWWSPDNSLQEKQKGS